MVHVVPTTNTQELIGEVKTSLLTQFGDTVVTLYLGLAEFQMR